MLTASLVVILVTEDQNGEGDYQDGGHGHFLKGVEAVRLPGISCPEGVGHDCSILDGADNSSDEAGCYERTEGDLECQEVLRVVGVFDRVSDIQENEDQCHGERYARDDCDEVDGLHGYD